MNGNYSVGLLIGVLCAFWVYKDASEKNNPNKVVWAIVAFLLGLIGLVIYLLAGRKTTAKK